MMTTNGNADNAELVLKRSELDACFKPSAIKEKITLNGMETAPLDGTHVILIGWSNAAVGRFADGKWQNMFGEEPLLQYGENPVGWIPFPTVKQ